MQIQDNSQSRQVAWIDSIEGKKLANDDSKNDLLYKENPDPVTVHKQL